MKKVIMILCMLLSVIGCSCKNDRIKLNKGEMPTVSESSTHLYEEFSLLSYEIENTNEYDSKIANKDSFLLFVYREGCYGCGLLAPALKSYVDNNSVAIYTISISNITNHRLYTEQGITETPYLIIISEGNIVKKEVVTLTNNANSNKEWVNNWINNNIIWEE